jgi:hypothetical protein
MGVSAWRTQEASSSVEDNHSPAADGRGRGLSRPGLMPRTLARTHRCPCQSEVSRRALAGCSSSAGQADGLATM